jgi:hypothetical protein
MRWQGKGICFLLSVNPVSLPQCKDSLLGLPFESFTGEKLTNDLIVHDEQKIHVF